MKRTYRPSLRRQYAAFRARCAAIGINLDAVSADASAEVGAIAELVEVVRRCGDDHALFVWVCRGGARPPAQQQSNPRNGETA